MHRADCINQGIPENIQHEEQQAPRQTARRTGGAPAGGAPPSIDPATPAVADPSTGTGDEPINLFEAAAQAGRTGGAGRGAPRQPSAGTTGLEGLTAAGAGAGAGAGGLGNLDFLRNNPQFQQLRQIVQTQPRMLEPILQQVGAGNPQLAQLIGQNPEQFLQLLSEDADEDAPMPPGAQAVSVTEEEREAIERVSQPVIVPVIPADSFSCVVLASREILSSRHISRATRMKSWQRISYLTNLMMGTMPRMVAPVTIMALCYGFTGSPAAVVHLPGGSHVSARPCCP